MERRKIMFLNKYLGKILEKLKKYFKRFKGRNSGEQTNVTNFLTPENIMEQRFVSLHSNQNRP